MNRRRPNKGRRSPLIAIVGPTFIKGFGVKRVERHLQFAASDTQLLQGSQRWLKRRSQASEFKRRGLPSRGGVPICTGTRPLDIRPQG